MTSAFARYRDAVPYFVVGVALTIVAVTLRRDGYLAGGDTYPGWAMPGNHVFEHSLQMWGNAFSGLGSPQYVPMSLVLAGFQSIGSHLGLSGPAIEWTFYFALLLAQGLGAAWFARELFPERRFISIAAGLGYPLCFYNALSINPVQAFSMGYVAAVAALLIARLKAPVSPLRFGIELGFLSLGLMLLVSTPPQAIFAVLWALLWIVAGLVGWKNTARVVPGLALGLLLGIAVNGWWLYAAAVTLYGSGGAAVPTIVGPIGWAFVHANASIANLLTMRGSWAYPNVEYYPWAGPYLGAHFVVALYVPAVLATVAVLLGPYRRRSLFLAAIVVVCLFIAKGTHEPFAALNSYLYDHVPYFWLWRDPQFEVDSALYFCLFVLAATGASEIACRFARGIATFMHGFAMRIAVGVVDVVLIAMMLLNGLPFIRGDFIPDTWLMGAARSIVRLPAYWSGAASFIDSQGDDGRVLLLPNDDFYAMGYSWGYYGNDLVAAQLIRRPSLLLAPGPRGYISGSVALRTELGYLQNAIATRSPEPIAPLLASLGVGWIIQRNDIAWSLSGRSILSPSTIAAYLRVQPGIKKIRSFGQLDVYEVETPPGFVKAFNGFGFWSVDATPDLTLMPSMSHGEVPWLLGVSSATQPGIAQGFIEYGDPAQTRAHILSTSGVALLVPRTVLVRAASASPAQLTVDVTGPAIENGGRLTAWRGHAQLRLRAPMSRTLVLELGAQRFAVDSRTLKPSPTTIGVYTLADRMVHVPLRLEVAPGDAIRHPKPLSATGATIDFAAQRIATRPGPIAMVVPIATNVLTDPMFKHGLWAPLFDAHRTGPISQEAGIKATVLPGGVLTLTARSHAAGVCQTLSGLDGRMIRVSFESRTVFGSAPVLRVLDRSSTLFYENPWVCPSANWTHTSADVFIRPASGNVGLCLYAFGDQTPTSVQFRELRLMPWPAGIGDLAWLGGSNPNELPVKFTASGVTRYDIAVPKRAKLLVLRSSFAPGWTLESAGHTLGYPHVPVYGYLNGWLLPSEAPSSVAAVYAPARTYQVLLWIAGIVFVSMVLVTIALWTRALLLRRGRPDSRDQEANDVKAAR